ncbi:hypothetical protein OEZ86_007811 [Tetradesmus obliquus]|nr:hypothetical protein OEZ86_007811 [Tetradesmus obliquus]
MLLWPLGPLTAAANGVPTCRRGGVCSDPIPGHHSPVCFRHLHVQEDYGAPQKSQLGACNRPGPTTW